MSVFALELQFMMLKIFWSRAWTQLQLVRRSQERGKEIVTFDIIKSKKRDKECFDATLKFQPLADSPADENIRTGDQNGPRSNWGKIYT